MPVCGDLKDYQFTQLVQLLDRGVKTGRLAVQLPQAPQPTLLIWFREGHVVASTVQGEPSALVKLMAQRCLIHQHQVGLLRQLARSSVPLGMALKTEGILLPEHLQLLFSLQLRNSFNRLLSASAGWFRFEERQAAPRSELTGLSLRGREALVLGLRQLQDWQALQHQLLAPGAVVRLKPASNPSLRLNSLERQVLQQLDPCCQVSELERRMPVSGQQIRQAIFRLQVLDLVQEDFARSIHSPKPLVLPGMPPDLPVPCVEDRQGLASVPGNEPGSTSQSEQGEQVPILRAFVDFLKGVA
ncbi:DUF4388 domain-containing protein [Leptolyngbya sp. FACHB-261]|uniref:DUF4388 domain-containing protein n=1 Tax=Leptolyngbya sp. FACHB-261 TaxID=2692806 RepID=UPI00168515AB|nr:DUF4388 domain-containing protein [Leptolyngbya sp. FACHB-261]